MESCHFLMSDEERRLEERIKTAVNKGKQTSLASCTKNINLSKFEHNDNDGPLVVFAEELRYPFGLLGHYKLVRNYITPNDDKNLTSHTTHAGKKRKISKPKQGLMLDEKERGTTVQVNDHVTAEKPGLKTVQNSSLKNELRLPKLRSGSIRQGGSHRGNYKSSISKNSESKTLNTELPQLPAQQYIDNFRKDAAEFERRLSLGFSRAAGKRISKGKTRDSLLPKIDEKTTMGQFPTDKPLSKDGDGDHIHLPQLKETHHETSSRKKRKPIRSEELRKTARQQDAKRSTMSHSERKAATQRERAKWCRKTMQSNSYV